MKQQTSLQINIEISKNQYVINIYLHKIIMNLHQIHTDPHKSEQHRQKLIQIIIKSTEINMKSTETLIIKNQYKST